MKLTPSQTQIKISWTNVPGEVVTSHFVYWRKTTTTVGSGTTTVNSLQTSYTITGLTSMITYKVQITSLSGSARSTIVSLTTSTGIFSVELSCLKQGVEL